MYYTPCKNRINTGNFELCAMNRTIAALLANGYITPAQHDELLALARGKADPALTVDLYQKFVELEGRVAALEDGKDPSKPAEEFPEYQVGKTYRTGDGVTFQTQHYRCIAPKFVVCVWSPADYPAYWEKA